MKFLPTGTCFDDSICFFITALRANPIAFDTAGFLLVHGALQAKDIKYAHAWVEAHGSVFNSFVDEDGKKGVIHLYKKEFYSKMDVVHRTKYTPKRVMALTFNSPMSKLMTGPWVEQYKKLCGIGGKLVGQPTTLTIRDVLALNQTGEQFEISPSKGKAGNPIAPAKSA